MLKKWLYILGALIFMMCALSGCKTGSDKEEEKPKKVGAILPGSPDEVYSESYFGYHGLKGLESRYGVEISYNEYVVPENAAFFLGEFAKKGYSVIIAQGSIYSEAITQVAAAYPDTLFVCIDGTGAGENIVNYDLRKEDMAFIAGVFSASISSYDGIAYLEPDGTEVEDSLSPFFDAGVKKVKGPQGVVEVFQVNNWSKNFMDTLRVIKDKSINVSGAYVNSRRLEEQMVETELTGVILNGYSGGDDTRPYMIGRVVVDYNRCYEIIYTDFLNGRPSVEFFGFSNDCILILGLDAQPESVRDNINSGLTEVK